MDALATHARMIRALRLGGDLGPVPWLVFGVLGGGFLIASVFVALLTYRTDFAVEGLVESGVFGAAAASLLALAYARRPKTPKRDVM